MAHNYKVPFWTITSSIIHWVKVLVKKEDPKIVQKQNDQVPQIPQSIIHILPKSVTSKFKQHSKELKIDKTQKYC